MKKSAPHFIRPAIKNEWRVGVLQLESVPGEPWMNRDNGLRGLDQAVTLGAECVLLPALSPSGEISWDEPSLERGQLLERAEEVGGETEGVWRDFAQREKIVVIGGLLEKEGDLLMETLLVVEPDKKSVRYRKTHLDRRERSFLCAGDQLVVVEVQGVPVGLMLGMDAWFPEVPRTLALRGAEVIFSAGARAWGPSALSMESDAVVELHLAHAYNSALFIACAQQTRRDTLPRVSPCALLSPYGPLTDPVSSDAELCLVATLELRQARFKQRTKRVHPLKDRRPSFYAALMRQDKGGMDETS